MPIYEFECRKCHTRFEKLCGMSAAANGVACPDCEGTDVKRLISSFYSMSSDTAPGGSASSSASCSGCQRSSCAGCR